MKRALVTGAYGFLGRHVALDLARAGYTVWGIGHGAWPADDHAAWGVSTWVAGDVDGAVLVALDCSPDLIVHCAGGSAVGVAEQDPVGDFQRSVGSTAALLQTQVRRWPDARLVYASSASVYGNAARQPLDESMPLAPVSIYGLHKRLAEQAIEFYAERFGLRASIVRLFSIYGAGLRKQLFWDACAKLSRGEGSFPGTGEETRDWLHVQDAAALMRIAGERPEPGLLVLNGGTGEARRVGAVLGLIARQIAPGCDVSFTGQRRSGDPEHYRAETGRARSLGWAPQSDFDAALAEYCAWFRRSAP
ncbi:NAD-dependent epimerase/dehydratase family protein [Bradyrhizobium sp. HKCCYLS2038]|uniref:NAD-dependent epimerase/dehydratase family protein n=1 Tax=unclassified Bradyrhizobium TaxID=2631580 RepID=UPI003EBC8145